MWGWGGARREIVQPRQGPPTSQRCSIKARSGAQSSAVITSHTYTHKGGVLAPQETLQARIATTKKFVSVDYPHCQVRAFFFSCPWQQQKVQGRWNARKILLNLDCFEEFGVMLCSLALALGISCSLQHIQN